MNSQEGKDVGNDRSECNNANPTQPQQSTSKVSSTTLSEDTEATQVSGSKGTITGKKLEVPATLAKEILMDKLQLCDQWDVVNTIPIFMEGREVLKHTQGAWISFPVSNWKKALDKMKAHEASAWHKRTKAKVEAEKQSQAEGSVIFQLKQGKREV